MNVLDWLVWGFAATAVLTTLLVAGQGMRLSRFNIPFVLGTMFTGNRDLAMVIGVGVHILNGWILSLGYIAAFHSLNQANWLLGMTIGIVHAVFILTVVLPVLPGFHPRMASEFRGPTVMKVLEPPGFLCLHYGFSTPLVVLVAHAVYGLILGVFYTVP